MTEKAGELLTTYLQLTAKNHIDGYRSQSPTLDKHHVAQFARFQKVSTFPLLRSRLHHENVFDL